MAFMETDQDRAMIGISTERVTLRPFDDGDAPETFAAITPGLTRFMNWEPPPSLEKFAEVWRSWLSAMNTGSELYFVIRASQEFVGIAGLHGLGEDQPELGLWIKEAAQGNGYGQEAMAALLAWASERFGPSAFKWPVAVDNAPSRRLAEKLDGVLVGTFDRPKYAGVLYQVPASRVSCVRKADDGSPEDSN
jgi:RimJ/RimL family protein N-acetyltransferase